MRLKILLTAAAFLLLLDAERRLAAIQRHLEEPFVMQLEDGTRIRYAKISGRLWRATKE